MRRLTAEPSEWNVYYVDPALDGDGTGTGRDGDGDGTERDGTGVVAGWEVLGDEVPGQRRVPLLVNYKTNISIYTTNSDFKKGCSCNI